MYSRFEARLGFMRPYLKRTKIDKKKMNSKRKQALIKKIYFTYLCLKKNRASKAPGLEFRILTDSVGYPTSHVNISLLS